LRFGRAVGLGVIGNPSGAAPRHDIEVVVRLNPKHSTFSSALRRRSSGTDRTLKEPIPRSRTDRLKGGKYGVGAICVRFITRELACAEAERYVKSMKSVVLDLEFEIILFLR
jgi:hypothetical protein